MYCLLKPVGFFHSDLNHKLLRLHVHSSAVNSVLFGMFFIIHDSTQFMSLLVTVSVVSCCWLVACVLVCVHWLGIINNNPFKLLAQVVIFPVLMNVYFIVYRM